MVNIFLTQDEANVLIKMEKHREKEEKHKFPDLGGKLEIPLTSSDKRENFLLNIYRGEINLKKVSYHNRARRVVILVRLDISGSPHRNPDNQVIECPHLHIYRENFGDKWAYPIPKDSFTNIGDIYKTLDDFMQYCNITKPPTIDKGLF
jgi:Family of unknown function (DUF6978)